MDRNIKHVGSTMQDILP